MNISNGIMKNPHHILHTHPWVFTLNPLFLIALKLLDAVLLTRRLHQWRQSMRNKHICLISDSEQRVDPAQTRAWMRLFPRQVCGSQIFWLLWLTFISHTSNFHMHSFQTHAFHAWTKIYFTPTTLFSWISKFCSSKPPPCLEVTCPRDKTIHFNN